MRVVQVVPHIDVEASGPSYSVPMLSRSVAAVGATVELFCQRGGPEIPGVHVKAFPEWKTKESYAISVPMALALWKAARALEIMHHHGLWSMCNIVAGWAVAGTKCRLVHSPRGTLSSWALAHSVRLKKAVWPFQRKAVLDADMIHATSVEELNEVRQVGYRGPIAVLPNGIDIPKRSGAFGSNRRRLLFLSRLHRKKGIELLLEAWAVLAPSFPEWDLWLVGVGELEYEASLRRVGLELGLRNLHFAGPLYGEEKSLCYRESDLFVLPTYSENFGMVVAEALAHGIPAVVTRGAPWEGLTQRGCGWWIESGTRPLIESLKVAMSRPRSELQAMGVIGRQWMAEEFGWDMIGARMADSYRWLQGEASSTPSWIAVD